MAILASWEAGEQDAGGVYADWLEERGDPLAANVRWIAETGRRPSPAGRDFPPGWIWISSLVTSPGDDPETPFGLQRHHLGPAASSG